MATYKKLSEFDTITSENMSGEFLTQITAVNSGTFSSKKASLSELSNYILNKFSATISGATQTVLDAVKKAFLIQGALPLLQSDTHLLTIPAGIYRVGNDNLNTDYIPSKWGTLLIFQTHSNYRACLLFQRDASAIYYRHGDNGSTGNTPAWTSGWRKVIPSDGTIQTVNCSAPYTVASNGNQTITASELSLSSRTPSGYTPIAIGRVVTGSQVVGVRAFNAYATGDQAMVTLRNLSGAAVTATVTVTVVFAKTDTVIIGQDT